MLTNPFARDGFVVAPAVLDDAVVRELRVALARLEREHAPTPRILFTHSPPPTGLPSLTMLLTQWRNAWQRLDPALGTRLLACVAEAVGDIAGYQPLPFQDVVTCKGKEQQVFPWHQDASYWPVDRDDGIVAWVALDAVDGSNGGLELAAGSHRRPVGPSVDLHTGRAQPGSGSSFEEPTSGTVPDLAAGDVLCFHARCVHRSGLNLTGASRRAWAVSFLHPLTRWDFARAPRHPFTSSVVDGEEVAPWSAQRYRHARV